MISILSASASTRRLIAFKFTHLPKTVIILGNFLSKIKIRTTATYRLFVLNILNFSIDLNSFTYVQKFLEIISEKALQLHHFCGT
jgi:hypothetical protein